MADQNLFVARPEDLAALSSFWQQAKGGGARFVRVVGPSGGGRRALVQELYGQIRASGEEHVAWRVACADSENGLQALVRLYGTLVGAIAQDVLLRGKVEMVLNGQLPREVKRVQDWFQAFVGGLKEAKPDAKTGQMQLRIPQDNPAIALVEIVHAISRRIPIVLELQQPYNAPTLLLPQVLEALQHEAGTDGKLLVILHDEPEGEVRSSTHPAPLLDLYTRKSEAFPALVIAPWAEAEVGAYLTSKGLSGDAASLARLGQGRPALIADLIEALKDAGRLGEPMGELTLASLAPMAVDDDELDAPPAGEPEPGRAHAGAADAERVAYFAALLGTSFPSALVAEMGGFEKQSVDDLLDAMGDLFKEVQFQESMGSWVYQFQRAAWREAVLERNNTDEGHEIGRRVAVFMERYLAPRGLTYVQRAGRLYGEHGAPRRAEAMRAMALTQDDANAWGLAYEILRWFDDVAWQEPLQRTIYFTLLDHLAAGGSLQSAERIHGEVTEWATAKGDRDMQGWLLLNGSKLDLRRQDLFRARDRARDALVVFEGTGAKQRQAEVHAHLAAIELQDGKHEEAVKQAEAALAASSVENEAGQRVVPPQIAAHAEMVRGSVARRTKKVGEAIEHFKRANEIAGNTGLGAIALDAGLAMGEALAASSKLDEAADVLGRVLMATRQIGQVGRERQAAELLIQIEGSRRDFVKALELAQRNLQISTQLKNEGMIASDLYHVGFFHLAQNKGSEAVPFFQQAEQKLAGQATTGLYREVVYHLGLATLQSGKADAAKVHLEKALPLLRSAGDARKLVTTLDALSAINARAGDAAAARTFLTEAISVTEAANMKDEHRALVKRLESLAS